MLIVKSLVIFFIIFIFVACVVWLYLTIDHIGDFIKTKKKRNIDLWKGSDSDERLILLVIIIVISILCVVWVVSDTREGYTSVLSFMMQFIGISLAILAAIIAFRNYRRKSGDHFSYIISSDLSEPITIMLRNDKDKTTSLFALDIILSDISDKNYKQRIRLANFVYPNINPVKLSAYEVTEIIFGSVFLYGNQSPSFFDDKKIAKVICITANGEKEATKFSTNELDDEFIRKERILLAYRLRRIPTYYNRDEIDPKSQYWVEVRNHDYNEFGQFRIQSHVLTGYIEQKRFFITQESLEFFNEKEHPSFHVYILEKLHGKKVDESSYSEQDCFDGATFSGSYDWDLFNFRSEQGRNPNRNDVGQGKFPNRTRIVNGLFKERELFDEDCAKSYPTYYLDSIVKIEKNNQP